MPHGDLICQASTTGTDSDVANTDTTCALLSSLPAAGEAERRWQVLFCGRGCDFLDVVLKLALAMGVAKSPEPIPICLVH